MIADNPVFVPPFLGTRIAKGIPLDDVLAYLNETALFRNQWGYRPDKGEKDDEFKERVRAELRACASMRAKAQDVLVPQVAWGYFAVNSDGNDPGIGFWSDVDRATLSNGARYASRFPRQRESPAISVHRRLLPL